MLHCYACDKDIIPKEELKKATNGMIQIKGSCPVCGKWLKWIPYADSSIIKTLLNEAYAKTLSSL